MIYKRNIIEFIREVLEGIDFTLTISSVVDNLNGTYDVLMPDIGYLEPLLPIVIGGNTYIIEGFITGGIKVSGTMPIVANAFTPYPPYFFQGTPMAINSELADINNVAFKTPMLYFYEILRETFFEDNDNAIERTSQLRLFFLTQADFMNWTTGNFHTNAIQPMHRFLEIFVNALINTRGVNEITDYEVINHNKFGVFTNNKGVETGIFTEEFSGCELNISLELRKKVICS